MIVGLQRHLRDIPCAQGQVRSTEDGEDHGKAMALTRDDARDQMTSLQCFNSMDMIEPDQHDREPGTFHNWNQLFVSDMMFISTTLHVKNAASLKRRFLL